MPEAPIPFNDLGRARDHEQLVWLASNVIGAGRFVRGREHDLFEREFADYLGGGRVLGCASGTDALELALRATGGLTRDYRVLTAANAGGYATAAIRRMGGIPFYADVEPDTFCLDVEQVARRITEVDAVVFTHLYGQIGRDVEEVALLCEANGVALVEDCAHAAGARRAGSFGDAAAFSFYPTKNLAAVGDGGAVYTREPETAWRVGLLREYGWGERYLLRLPGGFNSRLDELQAAVLRKRLLRLDDANKRRRRIALAYQRALSPGHGWMPIANSESDVAHLAVVVCRDRAELQARLAAAGIETAVHYPLPDHKQLSASERPSLPVTERACDSVLSLPCYPELTDREIGRICTAIS